MNTNKLHSEQYLLSSSLDKYNSKYGNPRKFPNTKTLITKKNTCRVLTKSQVNQLIKEVKENGYSANIEAIVEFETDKEGLDLAKKFAGLCKNPSVNLKVIFKKKQKQ